MTRKMTFWEVRKSLRKVLSVFDVVIIFAERWHDAVQRQLLSHHSLCMWQRQDNKEFTPKITVLLSGLALMGYKQEPALFSLLVEYSPPLLPCIIHGEFSSHFRAIKIFPLFSVSIWKHFLKAYTTLLPRKVLLNTVLSTALHETWVIQLNGQGDWKFWKTILSFVDFVPYLTEYALDLKDLPDKTISSYKFFNGCPVPK